MYEYSEYNETKYGLEAKLNLLIDAIGKLGYNTGLITKEAADNLSGPQALMVLEDLEIVYRLEQNAVRNANLHGIETTRHADSIVGY